MGKKEEENERKKIVGLLAGWPEIDGQDSKGTRWMPRHGKAKKDVSSCEKPWGAAQKR